MSLKQKFTLALLATAPFLLNACVPAEDPVKKAATEAFNASKIELPTTLLEAPKGVYEITLSTKDGFKNCIASVVKTTHSATNINLDCDAEASKTANDNDLALKPVELPFGLIEAKKGNYDVNIMTSKGERECMAAIVKTTHNATNTILTCN